MNRSHVTVRKLTLEEHDAESDRDDWANVPISEKLEETWRLSEELWRFSGRDPGEPGLSRSVVRILRR